MSVVPFISPALAFHGGVFRGYDRFFSHHFFIGGGFFGPFWGFPDGAYAYGNLYKYGYPYGYPAASPFPAAPAVTTQNVLYFCRASNRYYPYVQTCSVPWQQVSPAPQ
jgi:hypothetical protein